MKVLQAIIISFLAFGCSAGETTTNTSSTGGNANTVEPPVKEPAGQDACSVVACPAGPQGLPGVDGTNGSSCSVQQSGDNATISCSDGTTATLEGKEGAMGPAGPAGPAGASVVGPQGPAGASIVGPAGPVGPKGATGAPGVITASKVYTRIKSTTTSSARAFCDAGDFAISGGCAGPSGAYEYFPIVGDLRATDGQTPNGWECHFGYAASVEAYVVCVDAG